MNASSPSKYVAIKYMGIVGGKIGVLSSRIELKEEDLER